MLFSKSVLKKMVQELSPPMIITMAHEALDSANGDEVTDAMVDAATNVELFMAELKRRLPQNGTPPAQSTRKRNGEKAPEPESHSLVVLDRSGERTDP